jgi:hypothetical protein
LHRCYCLLSMQWVAAHRTPSPQLLALSKQPVLPVRSHKLKPRIAKLLVERRERAGHYKKQQRPASAPPRTALSARLSTSTSTSSSDDILQHSAEALLRELLPPSLLADASAAELFSDSTLPLAAILQRRAEADRWLKAEIGGTQSMLFEAETPWLHDAIAARKKEADRSAAQVYSTTLCSTLHSLLYRSTNMNRTSSTCTLSYSFTIHTAIVEHFSTATTTIALPC